MAGRSWHAADRRSSWWAACVARGQRGFSASWNLLFPPVCAVCEVALEAPDQNSRLCAVCRVALQSHTGPVCPRCGARADPGLVGPDGCPRCRLRGLRFAGVVSLGTYDGLLRRAVLRMKRPTGEVLAIAVSHLLADRVGRQLTAFEPDVVVPIPMHWTRRLVRGANSAETVAEVLGRRLRLPVAGRLLVRRRKTLPQFSLHPGERLRNIRGAFRVGRGYYLDEARILLVDDILTTGATCSEATRVLQAAGAARTMVAVVARAEGQ